MQELQGLCQSCPLPFPGHLLLQRLKATVLGALIPGPFPSPVAALVLTRLASRPSSPPPHCFIQGSHATGSCVLQSQHPSNGLAQHPEGTLPAPRCEGCPSSTPPWAVWAGPPRTPHERHATATGAVSVLSSGSLAGASDSQSQGPAQGEGHQLRPETAPPPSPSLRGAVSLQPTQ